MILFPQVVQKHTMGAVEDWTVIWSPVVSEILVSKIITIWESFKLQSQMSGMFFPDTV